MQPTLHDIVPEPDTTRLRLKGPDGIGDLLLWLPEGIATRTGMSSIYPVGRKWTENEGALVQTVEPDSILGPGNWSWIEDVRVECVGVPFFVDEPVRWTATVTPVEDGYDFAIALGHAGMRPVEQAAAAICVRYLDAKDLPDERIGAWSGGRYRTVADMGRDAGSTKMFQAYLIAGHTCEHPFYRGFWGINRHTVDLPVWVAEFPQAGRCAVVETDEAVFIHSNAGNPCTDLMMRFGDMAPGETATASGRIRFVEGTAASILERKAREATR